MNTVEKIRHLQGLQGSNAKLAFLQENRDDENLRQLLSLTYEPTISYYLTPDKKAKTGVTPDADVSVLLTEMRNTLGERVKTGGAAKAYYQELLGRTDDAGRFLIDAVLNRDIKAGIAETTINKVWPGLVTQIPYMRCTLPAVAKVQSWPWQAALPETSPAEGFFAYSQVKADGMYANVNVEGERVTITSRNGSVFLSGVWSQAVARQAIAAATAITKDYSPNYQFHGEMLVKKDGKVLPRKDGNGIMNSILSEGEMPDGGYEVVFVCWDAIPLGVAVSGGRWATPYQVRFTGLQKAVDALQSTAFTTVESRPVYTWKDAVDHFVEVTLRGEEGTILKRWDAQWMDGDSREQVKMKVSFQVDLKIVGFNPGDPNGKHAVTFGSLQCETDELGTTVVPLAVGVSGMSDKMRKEISDNRDNYTGKVVTVESNAVIMARDGTYSLFLPRLIEVRNDKLLADNLAHVKAQFEAAMAGKAVLKAKAK